MSQMNSKPGNQPPYRAQMKARIALKLLWFTMSALGLWIALPNAVAQAQITGGEIEFPFDQTDQKNEFSPSEVRRAIQSKTSDAEFYYVNPAMSPEACARPLSVEEKIDQQAGRSYSRLLQGANQLSRYRDGWLNRVIDHTSWLEWFLAQYKWNHLWAIASHPTIAAAAADLFAVRERTWQLQEREYGSGAGIGENDEADAFRHFVGAGLLFLRFGPANAEIILRVHEQDDVSMSSLMDRYNNEVAMAVMRDLAERGEITATSSIGAAEAVLIAKAKQLIEAGDLVVLRAKTPSLHSSAYPLALPGGSKFRAWAHRLLQSTLE